MRARIWIKNEFLFKNLEGENYLNKLHIKLIRQLRIIVELCQKVFSSNEMLTGKQKER